LDVNGDVLFRWQILAFGGLAGKGRWTLSPTSGDPRRGASTFGFPAT
jgi:hypothetical protein